MHSHNERGRRVHRLKELQEKSVKNRQGFDVGTHSLADLKGQDRNVDMLPSERKDER